MQLFIDNWSATLLAPATDTAVSFSVEPATAALLTGLGSGAFYRLTIVEVDASGAEIDWDVVQVTAVAAGVLTVTRTGTARSWTEGALIEARLTAEGMGELRDTAGGAAVGSDMPQALGSAAPGASPQASRQDHVHPAPTPGDIGAATAAQGAKADSAVQPAALTAALADKVDKVAGKGLSSNDFTDAEQAKLAGIAPGATANANTDSLAEGATNKYFTEGRVRSTVLTGLSLLTGGVISAADSVLSALGKLQKQISDAVTAIGGKQETLVSGTNLKTVNGNSLLGAGDLAISGSGMANPMTAEGDIIVGSTGGTPNRLGKGTALQVLRVNSAGTSLEYADPATGGGSLTNFTEAKSTASPNSAIPAVSLAVSAAEASCDLVLLAKSSGALLLNVPNDLASGGVKRGQSAIDLQRTRGGAGQVASGTRAVLIGGSNNTASNTEAVVVSAYLSTASGSNSGVYSGTQNAATATNAVVVGGSSNQANGDYSAIVGGMDATTRSVHGAEARASGYFSSKGDAQRQRHILRRATSDATASVLTTDGNSSAAATNQIVLPNNSAYAVIGRIVARAAATGDCASWEIKGTIRRGANAAATALVAAITPSLVSGDSGASSWTVAVTANSTLGCLTITVTGAGSTNIRWVADIETVEVVG